MKSKTWKCVDGTSAFLQSMVLLGILSLFSTVACGPDSGDGETYNTTVRILTANLASFSSSIPREKLGTAIEQANPDIIAIQEAGNLAQDLAEDLGFSKSVITLTARSASVLSRFPVKTLHDATVDLELCEKAIIRVAPIHTQYRPAVPLSYGPYALRDNPELTEQEIIAAQELEHGADIQSAISDMEDKETNEPVASFIAGDFNEPSHLDWTETASTQHFNRSIAWPSSTTIYEAGFVDGWRTIYPDPMTHPGNTWTPMPGVDEVHDRIDIIYHRGENVRPVSAEIIGEDADHAQIVVSPFPSDHRFVVVEYELTGLHCNPR